MKPFPAVIIGDEGRKWFALAQCEGSYQSSQATEASYLVLYVSLDKEPPRFAFFIYAEDGTQRLYLAGPDYSANVEAALIEAWTSFDVPVFAWSLVEKADTFEADPDRAGYLLARSELARALYGPRVKAWASHDMKVAPFFLPRGQAFSPKDPFKPTAENEEIMAAAIE